MVHSLDSYRSKCFLIYLCNGVRQSHYKENLHIYLSSKVGNIGFYDAFDILDFKQWLDVRSLLRGFTNRRDKLGLYLSGPHHRQFWLTETNACRRVPIEHFLLFHALVLHLDEYLGVPGPYCGFTYDQQSYAGSLSWKVEEAWSVKENCKWAWGY